MTTVECLQGRPILGILQYVSDRPWEPQRPGFKSWGHRVPVVQSCACYVTSVSLSFLDCKVGRIIAPTSKGWWKIK